MNRWAILAACALLSIGGGARGQTIVPGGGGGGSGTPGGTTGQVQYNNAGAFGGSAATITSGGSPTWRGDELFGTDNTYNIGASGATRPKNEYLAGNLVIGLDVGFTTKFSIYNNSFDGSATEKSGGYINFNTASDTGAATLEGMNLSLTSAGDVTGSMQGILVTATYNGHGATLPYLYGSKAIVGNSGASTSPVTLMTGYYVDHTINGTGTVATTIGYDDILGCCSSAGTVTDYYGYRFATPQIFGLGTVVNQYGFYAQDVVGATTKNYAIWTNVGKVHLGDHVALAGAGPVISSCGTTPTVAGSDTAGEVTTGTGSPTACTITFSAAYAAQPYCLLEDRSALANLTSYTVSTSAIVVTNTAASSQKLVYTCSGA